ncbi:hypothetical protein PAXRUDRAFT_29190 [Paxillus rubicundulus Ve08.2h10]|uniref:Uncharacterized protein n=1 Tax=Paxillus rubicundulus Ve08.2h10 TaxID=930991 RepID=A0A0D0CFF5_9AGAM|nr:hypothetical protein PAXRUDRAFT_29190 [Paxillus rubicundulus Ve08.2h10]
MSARAADNHSRGQATWRKFIKDSKVSMNINKVIDRCLTENERNAYQVMQQHGQRSVMDVRMDLTFHLLGDEAFVPDGRALHKHVTKFINNLVTITWNRFRKVVHMEISKMYRLLAAIHLMLSGKRLLSWRREYAH